MLVRIFFLPSRAPGTFSWKEHGLWRHCQLICIQIRQEKYSAEMRDGTKKNAGLSLKLTRRIASEEVTRYDKGVLYILKYLVKAY